MHCPLRTPPHSQSSRHYRHQPISRCQAVVVQKCSRRLRSRTVSVQAAAKTLYETLGVTQDASDRDIKKAYRQKALKLHPDVSKAADAQEQFLEVKNAFVVLSDAQQRAQYDRKLRGGFGDFGSWGSSTGGFGGTWGSSSSSSTGSRPRPKQADEEFYGLEDFFNDLEKEVTDWSKKRSTSGKPASLWEELSAIGEELVDFLEQGVKDEQPNGKSKSKADSWDGGGAGKEGSSSFKGSGSGSSSYSSSRARSPVDKYEELKKRYDMYDGGNNSSSRPGSSGSSGSSSSASSSSAASNTRTSQSPPARKTSEEEIDDMLAALKKKMNK